MGYDYRHCGRSVSRIEYHLLFCARYRRRIFEIEGVGTQVLDLARQICEQNDYILLDADCQADHCHLHINVPPTTSAGEAVRIFKNGIAEALKREFSAFERTQNFWTRDYFATTSSRLNKAEVENFLKLQKLRS